MHDTEKLKQSEIKLGKRSNFGAWLENYWYHYKWHTLISAFFVIIILISFAQCMAGSRHDVVVTYCGPKGFLMAETEGAREVFNRILPEDFDGNGEKYVEFVRYQVYSQEELEADRLANGGEGTINPVYNAQQLKTFDDFMRTGESSIYFISPYIYNHIKTRNNLRKISEVLDAIPLQTHDEYAIRLGDLALYRSEPALALLPEDTLVCLAVPYAIGSSADPDIYGRSVAMFREIVASTKK